VEYEPLLDQLRRLDAVRPARQGGNPPHTVRTKLPTDEELKPLFAALQRILVDIPEKRDFASEHVELLSGLIKRFGRPGDTSKQRTEALLKSVQAVLTEDEVDRWSKLLGRGTINERTGNSESVKYRAVYDLAGLLLRVCNKPARSRPRRARESAGKRVPREAQVRAGNLVPVRHENERLPIPRSEDCRITSITVDVGLDKDGLCLFTGTTYEITSKANDLSVIYLPPGGSDMLREFSWYKIAKKFQYLGGQIRFLYPNNGGDPILCFQLLDELIKKERYCFWIGASHFATDERSRRQCQALFFNRLDIEPKNVKFRIWLAESKNHVQVQVLDREYYWARESGEILKTIDISDGGFFEVTFKSGFEEAAGSGIVWGKVDAEGNYFRNPEAPKDE
jgi:hypothetical protein